MEESIFVFLTAIVGILIYYLFFRISSSESSSNLTAAANSASSKDDLSSRLMQRYSLQDNSSIMLCVKYPVAHAENVELCVELLQKLCNLYITIRCEDSSQEEAIRLQFSSVCGQFPSHRLLLHQTNIGKIAFARQIQPSLYIDYEVETIENLKKHISRVVYFNNEMELYSAMTN